MRHIRTLKTLALVHEAEDILARNKNPELQALADGVLSVLVFNLRRGVVIVDDQQYELIQSLEKTIKKKEVVHD